MSVELERARQQFAAGRFKRAVSSLWEAEVHARADLVEARALLELALQLREMTCGATRRDCDELIADAQRYIERELAAAQHPAVSVPTSPPLSGAAKAAFALAVVGFALCMTSLFAALSPRVLGGGPPTYVMLTWAWWAVARMAGFAGVWTALAGLGLASALRLRRPRKVRHDSASGVPVALCGLALVLVALAVGLLRLPPYFLRNPAEPTASQLNRLSPESVVRAYYDSQDLWVEYWLDDGANRAFWTGTNDFPDVSLLSGTSGLHVTPDLRDSSNPNTATQRSFWASYATHAPASTGAPPGPQQDLVNLVRMPGGPWRISYTGDGV